jgi:accessory gene regulator B
MLFIINNVLKGVDMIKFLSDKITCYLEENKLINSEDNEVCSYGLEVLISSLTNSVIILILGIILNKFIQTVVFVSCYCYIRQFAGGYHANSHGKCIFTFLCMYLITILVIGNINYIPLKFVIIAISILNWLSIYLLVPVEHVNNPLNNSEVVKNKKIARIRVTLFLLFIVIGAQFQGVYEYILYSSLALFWINFMLILQVVKNKGEYKNEKIIL